MLITCDKCNRQVEALVTAKPPHKVMCPECNKQIDAVTPFVVNALIREKKFVVDKKEAFSFYCDKDKGYYPGVLTKNEGKRSIVVCSKCGTKMNVTEFMITQLKVTNDLNSKKT